MAPQKVAPSTLFGLGSRRHRLQLIDRNAHGQLISAFFALFVLGDQAWVGGWERAGDIDAEYPFKEHNNPRKLWLTPH